MKRIAFSLAAVLSLQAQGNAPAREFRDPDKFQQVAVSGGKVSLQSCDLSKPISLVFNTKEAAEIEIPKGAEVEAVLMPEGCGWMRDFKRSDHLMVKPATASHPTLMVLVLKDDRKVVLSLRPVFKSH